MRSVIRRLVAKVQLWLQIKDEVARFDGIILAEMRTRQPTEFRDILCASLRLLKEVDPCRFARVRRRLAWIISDTLPWEGMAHYRHSTRTCEIDFIKPSPEFDVEYLIGYYASTLVHEATHGEICSRGVQRRKELRARIEQICVSEEQRFVDRLALTRPELADRIYYDFDAADWELFWNASPLERLKAQVRRFL